MPGTTRLTIQRANAFSVRRSTRPMADSRAASASRFARFQPEADLQHDLKLGDLAVLDEASLVHHLEPVEVAKRLRRLGDRVLGRLGVALFGNAAELDDLERLLRHGLPPTAEPRRAAPSRRRPPVRR